MVVWTSNMAPLKKKGGSMIAALRVLGIKACTPRRETVPGTETRGPKFSVRNTLLVEGP